MLPKTLLLVLSVFDWKDGNARALESTTKPSLVTPHNSQAVVAKEPTTKPSVRGAHANESTDQWNVDQNSHDTDSNSTTPKATRELSDQEPRKYDNNGIPLNWDVFKQQRNDRSLNPHLHADIEEQNRKTKSPATPTASIPTKKTRVPVTNMLQPRRTKTRELQVAGAPNNLTKIRTNLTLDQSIQGPCALIKPSNVSASTMIRRKTSAPINSTTGIFPASTMLLNASSAPNSTAAKNKIVVAVQSLAQRPNLQATDVED